MYFSKWPKAISTIFSQQTWASGYTALRYLVWENGVAKIWDTADPNLADPPKWAAIARMEWKFYRE